MKNTHILWVDDEMELLRPYIIFLEEKGYKVSTVNNGNDAIDLVKNNTYNLILLDENMPGKTGLQTLHEIKQLKNHIPVVMVTKSEEENIMEEAIGAKIADYLIKPVNPNQILLVIKKNIEKTKLINETTTTKYQSDFNKLLSNISFANSIDEWKSIYKQIVYWELELQKNHDNNIEEVLKMQKHEANIAFSKYIKRNYLSWFNPNNNERPLLSPMIMKKKIYPVLDEHKQVFVILIDNLRYDQWKIISEPIREFFKVEDEDLYCSILPTTTQYARNAIFSGLMPSEINKLYPEIWLNDEDDGGKNLHEEELLKKQHTRMGRKESLYYAKILHNKYGKKLIDNFSNLLNNDLVFLVYNFIDTLSHARTDLEMIKELADNEKAFRSLTLSWFEHSPLFEILKLIQQKQIPVIITTDHGCIKVNNPIKVVGDRNTTTNIRYKQGRSLNYNPKEVFEITDPTKAYLPKTNISSSYIFALENDFFAYPNNYNHFVNYYKNTFQHGGISLEEMLIPIVTLIPE